MTKLILMLIGLMIIGLIFVDCEELQNPIENQPFEQNSSNSSLEKGGYDEFGYNYQAHIFNGRYCDYDRVIGGEYCDVKQIFNSCEKISF